MAAAWPVKNSVADAYTNGAGKTTVLYSSDTVGAEAVLGTRAAGGEIGLNEAVAGMKEYFYLDSIAPSGSGVSP